MANTIAGAELLRVIEAASMPRARDEKAKAAGAVDAAWATLTRLENEHDDRLGLAADRAAIALVVWPAPDVTALAHKVSIIK